jgi:spermidine/putrescine transport system permease protein
VDPGLAGSEEELVAQTAPENVAVSAGVPAGRDAAAPEARKAPLGLRVRRNLDKVGGRTYAIVFIMLLYGPLVLLAVFSVNDSIVFSLPWSGFTTKWYSQALSDANLRVALRNSVIVAGIVAPASVILGTLAAYPITRLRFRMRGGAAMMLAAPLVVPWLVIGISALIYFNKVGVALSWHTVVLMHIVVTFPLVTVLVSASLARFDRTQEESAIDLGASQLQVVRHVLLPHIAPSLMASFILAFSWSFNNFEITYFVGGFDQLFPVWVYSTLRHASNLPIVNAISTLVSVIEVALVYTFWVLITRGAGARTSKEKTETLMDSIR